MPTTIVGVISFFGSKHILYQNEKCLKEVRVHVQNVTTILGSIVNILEGGVYDLFLYLVLDLWVLHLNFDIKTQSGA